MAHALFSLDGRAAFLTGAAGHLGRPMALALAQAGAHVTLCGRQGGPLEDLRDAMTARGFSAAIAVFDIMDESARRGALRAQPRLDILINNAYTGRAGPLESAREDDFARAFASGVTAAFDMTRAALPALKESGKASVINISSMYGHVSPDPGLYGASGLNSPPWYGAAKGGLIQLTRYLACHLAGDNIRVNAISPGPFPRPDVSGGDPDFLGRLSAKVPMKRVGGAHEIAGPVLFLASDASSYVTGVNLAVDGGWTAW